MTTPILDRVEQSLANFRPKTQREFVALQIAKRFSDLERLARYVNAAQQCPKNVLVEAARLATRRLEETGQPVTDSFFELLNQFREEGSL